MDLSNVTNIRVQLNFTHLQETPVSAKVVSPEGQFKVVHWDATPPFNHSEWIACETVQITCFLVALYILYALLHFYTVQQSRRIYSGHSSGSRWLEKMCIAAVLCAIVRFVSNQVLFLTGWHSRERCSIVLNVSIALYFVSLYPVYFFLWIRQRIFYSNRALKYLYNSVIRFVSWVTIFFFIVATAVGMILFVVDRKNSATGRVCADHSSPGVMLTSGEVNESVHHFEGMGIQARNVSQEKQGLRVNTLIGLLGSAIQLSFLVLFLYPIMDHKLRAVRNINLKCHHSLMKLIRRAFVLSGVCIFTDIGLAFGVKGVHATFPEADFALIVMYDINLIINIVCIIATFRRWRRMFFPWLYDCNGRSLLRQSTKTFFLQRRSTIGLNGSNFESFKISPKEPKDVNRSDVWEVKVEKPPVVDVLLASEDEFSEGEEKEQKTKKPVKENGNGKISPIALSRNGSGTYFSRNGFANALKDGVTLPSSNGPQHKKRENEDKFTDKNDATKLSNISRFKFSRSSLKHFRCRRENGSFSGFHGRRSYSLRKSQTTPNFANFMQSSRSRNTATVIRCEMIPEFTSQN